MALKYLLYLQSCKAGQKVNACSQSAAELEITENPAIKLTVSAYILKQANKLVLQTKKAIFNICPTITKILRETICSKLSQSNGERSVRIHMSSIYALLCQLKIKISWQLKRVHAQHKIKHSYKQLSCVSAPISASIVPLMFGLLEIILERKFSAFLK